MVTFSVSHKLTEGPPAIRHIHDIPSCFQTSTCSVPTSETSSCISLKSGNVLKNTKIENFVDRFINQTEERQKFGNFWQKLAMQQELLLVLLKIYIFKGHSKKLDHVCDYHHGINYLTIY
eukprot:XP_016658487.1 PREDICTED: uncharacterized protein LOC107883294 [Acyrthosiphon pisum]